MSRNDLLSRLYTYIRLYDVIDIPVHCLRINPIIRIIVLILSIRISDFCELRDAIIVNIIADFAESIN